MDEFSLIRLEWNIYNGFIFEILNIEIGNFDAALFSFNYSDALYVDIFFIKMQFILPWRRFF